MINLIIVPLIISAIISFLSTPLVIKFAWICGLIDDPKKNKHPKVLHTHPIPRGGGLAIFIAILITSLLFLPLTKEFSAILIGASIILIMGLLDDKYNLNPYLRLIIQFICAAIVVFSGTTINFITNPGGGIINLPFAIGAGISVFWIVFLMNGLNFGAKGVDGQLSGVVAIAAITIVLLTLKLGVNLTQIPVLILGSILAGSFLGFLPWHIYPQKIMPSFSGSNLAGFFLGILSILSTAKVGTLLVVLAIPLIDTGYVIIRRIISGKSPFWGDRGHLHHRLLDSGHLTIPQVAIFYWVGTALLGLISLSLNTSTKFYTIIGAGIFIGGLILWLTYKPKS
ncbi:MAG TPA: MraY family glycosyltransferase [Patescibacteria group bacterium]|nr:MraY family glycosyltransferase [Patescibacteria group bacterium]